MSKSDIVMKSKPQLANIIVDNSSTMSTVNDTLQGYKQALIDFDDKNGDKLSDDLEQFLLYVAKTGDTLSTWGKVQKVFIQKMKSVVDEFYEKHSYKDGKINDNCENDPYGEMKARLILLAEKFESPPFTIQRLCELVTRPEKNYTKCEKFMRALEKNLMVVTSWTYSSRRASESNPQLNGGLEPRVDFGTIETRPWGSLPHSPITTSVPTDPAPDKQPINPNDSGTDSATPTLAETDGTSIEEKTSVSDSQSDADSSAPQALPGGDAETADSTTSKPESPKNKSVEAMKDSTEEEMKISGDSLSVQLTNTEKDALKEPLPGVGTLMEKHAVKSTSTDTDSSAKVENENIELSRPAPSPKRKADDDPPMEVAVAAKRRKSTDGDVEMMNLEEKP